MILLIITLILVLLLISLFIGRKRLRACKTCVGNDEGLKWASSEDTITLTKEQLDTLTKKDGFSEVKLDDDTTMKIFTEEKADESTGGE